MTTGGKIPIAGETYGLKYEFLGTPSNTSEIHGISSNFNPTNFSLSNGVYVYSVVSNTTSNNSATNYRIFGIRNYHNGDISATGILYAINARYEGTVDPSGRAYGIYLSGHTHNYIDGASLFNGSIEVPSGIFVNGSNVHIKSDAQIIEPSTADSGSQEYAFTNANNTINYTYTPVDYDRVLYFNTQPFYAAQKPVAGYLSIRIEIGGNDVYFGLSTGSDPSEHGLIHNYSGIIPAGLGASIEFVTGSSFSIVGGGTNSVVWRWYTRKFGRAIPY